ncbi:MAG: heme exporter protein CcmB, partial [Gemmatimonadota bacterium]|nr:heme exporter protein CcmB [Gemmatimonadota bacterium]
GGRGGVGAGLHRARGGRGVVGAYLGQVAAVARKDLLLELRSRERLVVTGTFAVLVAVVFSFSLDPTVRARSITGAMIWVTVLFAGILGLGRSFAMEREDEALSGILLAPVDRGAVFLGKFLANLAILLAVEALVFPVYALFFGVAFTGSLAGVAAIVLLASAGFMLLGTLFAAVSAHTRLGETVLPILLLPLLIPVVIFAVSGTQRLLVGRPLEEVTGNLKMLLAFDLIYLIVCTLTFGFVVEE